MEYSILPILGLLLLISRLFYNPKLDGQKLQKKFIELGNMSHMTRDEIITKTASPKSIGNLSHGQLLQWHATGYHIAILFTYEGKFVKITSEYAA